MIIRIDPIYPFGTQFYAHSASDAPLPVDSKLRGNRKTERIRAPFAAKRAALKKYHRAYSIPIRISEVTKIEYNSFFLFSHFFHPLSLRSASCPQCVLPKDPVPVLFLAVHNTIICHIYKITKNRPQRM